MKLFSSLFALLAIVVIVKGQNYDEQLVPRYVLPSFLTTAGKKATLDKTEWINRRREEILRLFEDNIYGQMPKDFDSIKYNSVHTDKAAMDGKAILKQTDIQVFRKSKSITIHLVIFVPSQTNNPAPLFLLINNRGKNNTDPSRTIKTEFWPAEQLIDSGYAIAAFHVSDLAPDDKNTFMNGVLQLYPVQLSADNGMRAIGAWAWGASRVMDYIETEKSIDSRKVAVVGHSRGGKAALWASAQDTRFSICFSSCSGNSGAALARRRFGETIEKINATFPHWFCNNYKDFNNREDDLPVDQHMLIALSAPRFVYTTNATKDLWADPAGSFLSMKYAESVFLLYSLKSTLPANIPLPDHPVIQSPLGYHLRTGIHDLTAYDWGNFIRFANYHYKKK